MRLFIFLFLVTFIDKKTISMSTVKDDLTIDDSTIIDSKKVDELFDNEVPESQNVSNKSKLDSDKTMPSSVELDNIMETFINARWEEGELENVIQCEMTSYCLIKVFEFYSYACAGAALLGTLLLFFVSSFN